MAETDISVKPPIVNGVLCYISTARHSMKSEDIIRICHAFFKDDDILKGKDLLCELIGQKPIRRRNENRIVNELRDIVDILKKCDETAVVLPKFVVDTFDGLPPSSGFEVIANTLVSLNDEIAMLKKEVETLRDSRVEQSIVSHDNIVMKEDLLFIKGELRKLNLRFMNGDIRRNSIALENLEKSFQQSPVSVHTRKSTKNFPDGGILDTENSVLDGDFSMSNKDGFNIPDAAAATAPPPPPPPLPPPPPISSPIESGELLAILDKSVQDEGGVPSAPSYSQVAGMHGNSREIDGIHARSVRSREGRTGSEANRSFHPRKSQQSKSSQVVIDADGFQLVQRNRRKRENIIGSKKMDENKMVKSAARMADLYVGNLDVNVTVEAIVDYVKNDIGVAIEKCETLKSRNPNYSSFKLSLTLDNRNKLLVPEAWPEGIICRKFYSSRNSK